MCITGLSTYCVKITVQSANYSTETFSRMSFYERDDWLQLMHHDYCKDAIVGRRNHGCLISSAVIQPWGNGHFIQSQTIPNGSWGTNRTWANRTTGTSVWICPIPRSSIEPILLSTRCSLKHPFHPNQGVNYNNFAQGMRQM